MKHVNVPIDLTMVASLRQLCAIPVFCSVQLAAAHTCSAVQHLGLRWFSCVSCADVFYAERTGAGILHQMFYAGLLSSYSSSQVQAEYRCGERSALWPAQLLALQQVGWCVHVGAIWAASGAARTGFWIQCHATKAPA